ncbi:MAG: hypothetical protein QNJ09_04720 [Paracoccaceae bacterium]|nr:hypothetical protein [Paracoccaceae bacterium]
MITPAAAPQSTTEVRRAPAAAPAPQVRRVVRAPASKPAAAPPPRVIRPVPVQQPKPAAPAMRRVAVSTDPAGCSGTSGMAPFYVRGPDGVAVRCGPNRTHRVMVVRRATSVDPAEGTRVRQMQPAQDSALYRGGCSGTTGMAPFYVRGADGVAIRCGTQSAQISTQGRLTQSRIVPRHVYEQRSQSVAMVPAGYRPAWTDDRLNPYRAYQTVDGYRSTQMVWTNKVPRQLVATSGRAARIKDPVIVGRAATVSTQGREAVVSTRSAPNRPAAAKARYVEIGVFTTDAKAQVAVQRLRAAGLPVRVSTTRYNGAPARRVVLGPYAGNSLQAGLAAARRAGYPQAYLR